MYTPVSACTGIVPGNMDVPLCSPNRVSCVGSIRLTNGTYVAGVTLLSSLPFFATGFLWLS